MQRKILTTAATAVAVTAALALALFALTGCASVPSIEREKRLAAQIEQQVKKEFVFLNDPIINNYITGIGEELLAAAGPQPFAYTFSVVDDEAVNAFATLGGGIYVHTGIILEMGNVSELAGVMAHEIAHIAKRHSAQKLARQENAQFLQRALVLATGVRTGSRAAVDAVSGLTGISALAYLNSFGRDAEREADAFAVELLPRANYHPLGVVTGFEALKSHSRGASFLSSHPATVERIASARAKVAEATLAPTLRVNDSGRLEVIQYRIRCLTGKIQSGPCAVLRQTRPR